MTAEELARRDARQLLSKSFITGADLCGQRAWMDLRHPRKFVMTEQVMYGKAVDLGVQVIVGMINAGLDLTAEAHRIADAVHDLLQQQELDVAVDPDDVFRALDAFVRDVVNTDLIPLSGAIAQHHLRLLVPDVGMMDGHPDLILRDGTVVDIKTSSRAKPQDAAAVAYTELGLYALMRELETGQRPPQVAYLTWVRSRSPYWQLVTAPVTDTMLTIAHGRAAQVAAAIQADTILNEGAAVPRNYSFPTGPRFPGLCGGCAHNPASGGRCTITETGPALDA